MYLDDLILRDNISPFPVFCLNKDKRATYKCQFNFTENTNHEIKYWPLRASFWQ